MPTVAIKAAAFGQPRLRAEHVADQVAKQARDWLGGETAVAEHLADQLLLPMALAGGGSFTTPRRTAHLDSNIQVIEAFMPVSIHCESLGPERLQVSVRA